MAGATTFEAGSRAKPHIHEFDQTDVEDDGVLATEAGTRRLLVR